MRKTTWSMSPKRSRLRKRVTKNTNRERWCYYRSSNLAPNWLGPICPSFFVKIVLCFKLSPMHSANPNFFSSNFCNILLYLLIFYLTTTITYSRWRIVDEPNAEQRMAKVLHWYFECIRSCRLEMAMARKPFNPVLGEHFKCVWNVKDGTLATKSRNIFRIWWYFCIR